MKSPKIIAHRGLSSLYPENSLIAFGKAIELGADGVECDLHRTADGTLVVIHDATIDRTTTGEGLICRLTLEEIRRFCLATPQGPGGRHEWPETVPTFDEFVDVIEPSILELRIEIKEVGFEEQVAAKIKSRGLTERATVISFLPTAIYAVKNEDRSIRTSLLTSRFAQIRYEHIRPYIDAVDFGFGPELERGMYDRARRDGLTLDFWTIDDLDEFRRALEWEPDYVTTNFPQRLMKALGRPVP